MLFLRRCDADGWFREKQTKGGSRPEWVKRSSNVSLSTGRVSQSQLSSEALWRSVTGLRSLTSQPGGDLSNKSPEPQAPSVLLRVLLCSVNSISHRSDLEEIISSQSCTAPAAALWLITKGPAVADGGVIDLSGLISHSPPLVRSCPLTPGTDQCH